MTGKIVLEIKLDPKGDVQRVDKVGGSGLSTDVEGCIVRKAKNATS